MQRGDAFQTAQYRAAQLQAGGDGGVHRHVENHPGQHRVLVLEVQQTGGTQQVGAVFPLRHEPCRGGSGATFGQAYTEAPDAVIRGAASACTEINMSACCGRSPHACAAARRSHRCAPASHRNLSPLQAFGQQLGDGQHHVFFALALGTDSTRVFATVAGVDHDNDVALGVRLFVDVSRCATIERGTCGVHRSSTRRCPCPSCGAKTKLLSCIGAFRSSTMRVSPCRNARSGSR
jgi:hypothetical protein